MSALGLVLLALALAQAATPTFPARVDAVYVDVFVTDGRRPVAGLAAADFELRDNGVRQPIELVAVEAMPLATFLVLDASGSVTGDKLVQLHSALRTFVGKLRPEDEAALLTFDHEIRLLMPRTRNRDALAGAIDEVGPGGSTALFDALYAGAQLATGRALIVLFTDGEDNSSAISAEGKASSLRMASGGGGAGGSYFERQKENGWRFSFREFQGSSQRSSRRKPSPSRKRRV